MPHPSLDCPGVVAGIRQRVAAGMPQRVRVYLKAALGYLAGTRATLVGATLLAAA